MLLMQRLEHIVLLMDTVLDPVQIGRHSPVILLLQIVSRLLHFLCSRENVLDRVGHNKIFVSLETQHRSLIHPRNRCLLVTAVVGKVSNRWQSAIPHCSGIFLTEVVRRRTSLVFEISQRRPITVLCMRLEPHSKLSRKISNLNRWKITPGLEVVLWQKVDPVGGILGGYFDR
jgi:hypothetical protein